MRIIRVLRNPYKVKYFPNRPWSYIKDMSPQAIFTSGLIKHHRPPNYGVCVKNKHNLVTDFTGRRH